MKNKAGNLSGLSIAPCWTVGKLLGTGACSEGVYSISSSSRDEKKWCVKFSRTSPAGAPGGKKRKKKKTEQERMADLIFYEYQIYSGTVNRGRGKWCCDIPDIRHKPYGTVTTKSGVALCYLIMEYVPYPLYHNCSTPADVVNRTLALVDSLESLHSTGLVMVDVKKDNCRVDKKGNVRVLDFGTVERFNTLAGKSRSSSGAGTPSYWSRNVGEGGVCMPQDDLESCAYICHEEIDKGLPWDGMGEDDMRDEKRAFCMGEVGDRGVKRGLMEWAKRMKAKKGKRKSR